MTLSHVKDGADERYYLNSDWFGLRRIPYWAFRVLKVFI